MGKLRERSHFMEHRPYTPDLVISSDCAVVGDQFSGEPSPNVAHEKLLKTQQMGRATNCSDLELCTYLQALEEGYLPTFNLGTNQCVQLKSNPIASKSYTRGRLTIQFLGFPSLQMYKLSTESRGKDSSTASAEAFLAKTSVQPAKAQGSMESAQACGATSHALLAKYDPATHSLKTAQCSLLEDLTECSVTLLRWGSMRNGDVFLQVKSARITGVTESGLLPDGHNYHHTPNTHGMDGRSNSRKALAARQLPWATPTTMDKLPPKSEQALFREMTIARPGRSQPANLRDQVSNSQNWPTPMSRDHHPGGKGQFSELLPQVIAKYPTPCSTDHKGSGQSGDLRDRLDYAIERGGTKSNTYAAPTVAGQLNPDWVEWLMGWPIGWTDLAPRTLKLIDWKTDPANLPIDHPDYTPRVATNIPNRAARIKCIGNGQVPQCAATAFLVLAERLGATPC